MLNLCSQIMLRWGKRLYKLWHSLLRFGGNLFQTLSEKFLSLHVFLSALEITHIWGLNTPLFLMNKQGRCFGTPHRCSEMLISSLISIRVGGVLRFSFINLF